MYSSKPRTFAASKNDISFLPLDEIGKKFKNLMLSSYQDYNHHKAYLLEKAHNDFLSRWNSQNEASYEGSLEELGLEGKVLAALGTFSGLGSEQKEELKRYLEDITARMALVNKAEWFFPQALAEFARLPLVKNEFGYSAKILLNSQIKPNDTLSGLYVLFKYAPRSLLLKNQTEQNNRNYCSLVPLIMSAFKKHHNVKYSEWDKNEVQLITEEGLASAMALGSLPEMSVAEVIAARDAALTPRSGAKAGVARSPLTTYTLYVTRDYPELLELPPLARIMMCQTWCAHPSNRTQYMITNPLDWDTMPEPLVSSAVLREFIKPATALAPATALGSEQVFDW